MGSACRRNRRPVSRPDRCALVPETCSQAPSQAQDRDVVFLQELPDAFRACLALVRAARIGVEVVRVELEGDQPERGQRAWLDDRHVVGGAGGRAGQVGAGAGARYGTPACAACRSPSSTPSLVRVRSSRSALPPTNTARASATAAAGSTGLVEAGDPDARPGQHLAHDAGVGVRVAAGKRHEQQAATVTQHSLDGLGRVLQESHSRGGGIGQQQQLGHLPTLAAGAPAPIRCRTTAGSAARVTAGPAAPHAIAAVRRGNGVWKLRRDGRARPGRSEPGRPWPPVGRGFPAGLANESRGSGQDSLSVCPGGTSVQRSSRSRTPWMAMAIVWSSTPAGRSSRDGSCCRAARSRTLDGVSGPSPHRLATQLVIVLARRCPG
jgi:hypothetical protein